MLSLSYVLRLQNNLATSNYWIMSQCILSTHSLSVKKDNINVITLEYLKAVSKAVGGLCVYPVTTS